MVMPLTFPDDMNDGGSSSQKYLRLNKLAKDPKTGIKSVRVRVLLGFINGSEAWTEDSKVYRKPTEAEVLEALAADGKVLRVEKDRKNPKQFFGCVITNITDDVPIQVLAGPQMSVPRQIKALAENPEWGNGGDYDIIIESTVDTNGVVKYTVSPCKPTKLPAKVVEAFAKFQDTAVGLDALFHNADPFADWSEGGGK
jgi:hypothetical protein